MNVESWRFAAVVPSYGDPTYTPWIVGVKDETDLDALEEMAREWNDEREPEDDLGLDDFIAEKVEGDPRFKVLCSAHVHGPVVLEID
jgi:hypothetical protein